jgi:hypothetical protein
MIQLSSAENQFSLWGSPTIIFMAVNFLMSVFHRLIPSFADRPSIRKFLVQQALGAQNPLWNRALFSIVDGQAHNIEDWRAVGNTLR